jgi:hypothetical protein
MCHEHVGEQLLIKYLSICTLCGDIDHKIFVINFSVLLERVFLRLGLAETDDQLQNLLAKFLTPVLLKLASPEEGVRKKVIRCK